MRVLRSWYTILLALPACAPASEPSEPLSIRPDYNLGNGVVLTVQGAGAVDFLGARGDFQFIALKRADGTVMGHFRQSRIRVGFLVEFEGDVTCVTVDPAFPGRARIGGVITSNTSTDPLFTTENHEVGDDVWFRVEDGESGGSGDKSTTYGFKPTLVDRSDQYCALPFDGLPWWNPATIFPLMEGTIRIDQ